ncbi:hypothetical protein X798_05106 [Onchocerca flexuosa]|uniref:Movement protein n=2 Tax=Onchocerca flexuosa TaxID=387005 RepID=A0A183HM48_9BILA|nr:hypothetical protein X798_05106 [Onchocerca flexuosa]VDO56263.1 unnamed protein product [Onchocerca flexuosa]
MENKINGSLEQILRVLIPENAYMNSSSGHLPKSTSARTIYSSRSASGIHPFRLGNRSEELIPLRLPSSHSPMDDISSPLIGTSTTPPAMVPTTSRSFLSHRSGRSPLVSTTSDQSTPTRSDLSPEDTDTLL